MESFCAVFKEFDIDVSHINTVGKIMKAADDIIAAAEKLKAIKEERIAALKKFGPIIFESDDNDLTVSLLRNDKEELIEYGKQYVISVNRTDSTSVIEKYNLTRGSNTNSFVYFLYATPGYYATPEEFRTLKTFCTQISYAESLILNKHFKEMKEKVKLQWKAVKAAAEEEERLLQAQHEEIDEEEIMKEIEKIEEEYKEL